MDTLRKEDATSEETLEDLEDEGSLDGDYADEEDGLSPDGDFDDEDDLENADPV